jgi:type IV pilus assembly protein PilZ
MAEDNTLSYTISDPVELNLSFMPFINGGGLFIPTQQKFDLDTRITLHLQLPGYTDTLTIPGKIIWITPPNALHHVLSGVGIQFTGPDAKTIRAQIETLMDNAMEVGGYTYGILGDNKKDK